MSKPKIAVTMGDPAGVGPEICLHLLANDALAKECTPIVFGDAAILWRVAAAANLPLKGTVITPAEWDATHNAIDQPSILDLQSINADAVDPGQVSAATGRAAFTYIDRAIEAALAG